MVANLKQRAYEHVRERLLQGRLPAGSALSPMVLAKEMGISHTPVREAICQLETEGLVEQIPGLGPHVKTMTRSELEDLFELREILESAAASKAAARVTDEEIANLQRLCAAYRPLVNAFRTAGAVDGREVIVQMTMIDVAFHLTLLGIADNRRICKIAGDLHLLTHVFRWESVPANALALHLASRTYRDHCRIARAFAQRDAETARELVSAHIRDSARRHLAMFDARARHANAHPASNWPDRVMQMIASMERKLSEQTKIDDATTTGAVPTTRAYRLLKPRRAPSTEPQRSSDEPA